MLHDQDRNSGWMHCPVCGERWLNLVTSGLEEGYKAGVAVEDGEIVEVLAGKMLWSDSGGDTYVHCEVCGWRFDIPEDMEVEWT